MFNFVYVTADNVVVVWAVGVDAIDLECGLG